MRWFKCLAIGLVFSLLALWQALSWWQFLRTPLVPAGQSQLIEVKPGSGIFSLKVELQRRGLLQNPVYFEWLANITGAANRLKAGEYNLPPGITPMALLDLLGSANVVQHDMILVEGWNASQILAALASNPALTHTLADLSLAEIKTCLGISEASIEGLFFPDTYRFIKGTTDVSFLLRAYAAMQNYLQTEWSNRQPNLPYQTPYQALIAASLIEKEAKLAEERPLISGVIVKRLQTEMRLQIDASVIYGLGENYTGKLRRRDMQVDTPYNTYLYKGLPPTPIALPSLASLHAALHPVITDNIFYVARGDGGHYFSANLTKHNAAIQQYLIKQRNKPMIIGYGPYSVNWFDMNAILLKLCVTDDFRNK
jgi:UPF0755 protein